MKLVARIHAWKNRMYEHLMLFLARHAPKTNEHINDKPFVVAASPGRVNFCLYCLWTYMIWDNESEMWTCPTCGVSCHPSLALAITEKRAVVQPVQALVPMPGIERHTEPHTMLGEYKVLPLPEQRAVQPPHTPHIFSLAKEPKQGQYIPGRYLRKLNTDEIELRDGKPCYKNGPRVNTEQFKRIIFPPTDDRRTG